jgi:photosystem II stability/assembly factor-like uncharacterized protein
MRRTTALLSISTLVLAGTGLWSFTRERTEVLPLKQVHESPEMARAMTKRPSQYWFEQRSFPSGMIPVDLVEETRQRAFIEYQQSQLSTSGVNPLTWELVGPTNIHGRITALAATTDAMTFYAGAANGGVWKTTNGGLNWAPIFDEFHAYSIGDIQIDPTNANIVWVGTGESNPAIDTYDGNGLYRSMDGGANWEHIGLSQVKRVARIAIDSTNTSRMYVAGGGSLFQSDTDGGIWRTTDGGTNWEHVLFADPATMGTDVAINPAHPESLHAAMWDLGASPTTESAIWRSTDFGATWTKLGPAQGLPAANDSTDRISIAYAKSRPTTIYAQIVGGPAMGYVGRGMWRSDNGGATWTKRDAGTTFRDAFGGFGWYFGTMAVSPNNPEFSYALGVQTMRSTNGGTSYFYQNGTTLHVDQHAVWIQPSNNTRVFIGSDGGFYRTLNGGSSWSKLGALPITQFYAITVNPQDNLQRFGGTQDNNTLTGTTNPATWSAVLGGDGFYCLVDHTDPSVVFAEFQNMCGGTGPRRSAGGGPYTQPTGFNPGDRYNWNAPYVMDPTDHNILLAGSHRIYKSVNNGVAYSVSSPDLAFAPGTPRPNGTISTITISPQNNQIYYTGSSNGKLWRSTDGGANWTDKTGTLPVRYITRVTADPFDANTVFTSLSGFNGSNEEPVHVYKSTDMGDSWVNVSGNLPNAPVNDILVDNLDPNRWYAGTDLGVWTTQNAGETWYPLGQGLPFQAIYDIYLHEGARELYAGTHGRSMWKVNLSELPTAVGNPGPAPKLALSAPRPNPSRGDARFNLSLDRDAAVNISVFDALGRRTGVIHDGELAAGRHSLSWNGRDAGGRSARSGVYFLRAESGGRVETQRIVLTQ